MGVHDNIGFVREHFPRQGDLLGRRTSVCFRYESSDTIAGTIIRDDVEDPMRTVIQLDDGRVVLGDECQYRMPSSLTRRPRS